MTDTTPTPTDERKPTLSLMISSGRVPFKVDPVVETDDTPEGERRIRVCFGDATLFIQRRDVLSLMSALNEAMFA